MDDMGNPTKETRIVWEFEGAFSIVLKESAEHRKLVAAGLQADGFHIYSIRYACDIAAGANMKITGVCAPGRDGIHVRKSFIAYSSIDTIICADGTTLWTSSTRQSP